MARAFAAAGCAREPRRASTLARGLFPLPFITVEWNPEPQDQSPFWPGAAESRRPKWSAILIAVAVVILVVAGVIWWLGRGSDDDSPTTVPEDRTEEPDDRHRIRRTGGRRRRRRR